MASPGPEFSETNFHRNERGGRPKIIIPVKDLERCKGSTRKAAAAALGVSESTLKRRIKELGYNTWYEFQGSASVFRAAQDEVALIFVKYGEKEQLFDLAAIEEKNRFQKLENLIERNFNLLAGTYNIKWYVRIMDNNCSVFTIGCNDSLKGCLSWASKQQFNPILLTVENN